MTYFNDQEQFLCDGVDEMEDNFVLKFFLLWVCISYGFSLIGRWWELSRKYKLRTSFDGQKW